MFGDKKHIVYIVLDAFCYRILERYVGNHSITPFLSSMMKRGFSASNMFSPAPYTEAAMVSVLGDEATLENGGYLLGNTFIAQSKAEFFKNNNFRTITSFAPYIASQSYLRGFDDYIYTKKFNMFPLFKYRLEYFHSLLLSKSFSKEDLLVCEYLLEDALFTWHKQLIDLQEQNPSVELFLKNFKIDVSIKQHLEAEIQDFKRNKSDFTIKVIQNLYKSSIYILNEKYNDGTISFDVAPKLIEQYKPTFLEEQKRIRNIIKNNYALIKDRKYISHFFKSNGLRSGVRLLKRYRLFKNNNELLYSLKGGGRRLSH